jgi:O-antigen ligase
MRIIHNVGLNLVFFTIPLSSFVSVRAVFVLLFFGLANQRNWKVAFQRASDIMVYFALLAAGLLYTTDLTTGVGVLETSFVLLAFPFLLSYEKKFDENRMQYLFRSFSMGLLVAVLICLAYAFVRFSDSGDARVFYFYDLTRVIDFQPTYFAYYLIFAITFELYLLNESKTDLQNFWSVSLILVFAITLLLTGGQTSFISLLLSSSFFILKFLLEERTPSRVLAVLVTICVICLMFFHSYFNASRDTELLSDSWERIELWKSAISANTSFLFGEGTGDYKLVLNNYYLRHGMSEFAANSFNAHNQFIEVFLSNGIIGVIITLIMVGRPLYFSIRANHDLGVLVFFPFLMYGMTEVFLGRYQGVVFFVVLHQVFISYYTSNKPPLELKDN